MLVNEGFKCEQDLTVALKEFEWQKNNATILIVRAGSFLEAVAPEHGSGSKHLRTGGIWVVFCFFLI